MSRKTYKNPQSCEHCGYFTGTNPSSMFFILYDSMYCIYCQDANEPDSEQFDTDVAEELVLAKKYHSRELKRLSK